MVTMNEIEKMVKARAGVVMLMSQPGGGKSALCEWLAEKNGWQFIDLRLSQMDQAEVTGLYDRQDKMVILRPQEWAVKANSAPTLVCFDELNRASRETRNSALQILNERRVGWNFKFNDEVYMIACGNLGEEDNTDVDEFDDAMKNRLIPIKINVNEASWIKQWLTWAKDQGKIHPRIIDFITKKPEYLFKKGSADDLAFATARSWTFFSRLLTSNNVKNEDDLITTSNTYASYYIGGTASTAFVKHINDTRHIKLDDILNRFSDIKDKIASLPRDKVSELLAELGEKDINKFSQKQLNNIIEFCQNVDQDEVTGYLQNLSINSFTGDADTTKQKNLVTFLKAFKPLIMKVKQTYDNIKDEAEKNAKKE